MPYGDLKAQRVQLYATLEDWNDTRLTIEEREETSPHHVRHDHLRGGRLRRDPVAGEAESDVLLWKKGTTNCRSTGRP